LEFLRLKDPDLFKNVCRSLPSQSWFCKVPVSKAFFSLPCARHEQAGHAHKERDGFPWHMVLGAGDKLYLRVERQTFAHLPETQSVLFTIHTFVRPLGKVTYPIPFG